MSPEPTGVHGLLKQRKLFTHKYMDYYKILNVPHQADGSQIKQAYRKLAKRYYPDLNPYNPETEARFKDIVEAYETLGDPAKCRKYDANMIQSSATMGTEPKAQKAALCRCRAGRQLWQFYKGYGALFRIPYSINKNKRQHIGQ